MPKKKKKSKIKKRKSTKRKVKSRKKIPKKRKVIKRKSSKNKKNDASAQELVFKTRPEWIKASLANNSQYQKTSSSLARKR